MTAVIDIDRGWKRLLELQDTFIEVGTDVPYAKYLEFGTLRMDPHPFMGPAFDAHGNYGQELEAVTHRVLGGARPGVVMRELGAQIQQHLEQEITARRLIKTGRLLASQTFDVLQVSGEP